MPEYTTYFIRAPSNVDHPFENFLESLMIYHLIGGIALISN